MKLSIATCQFPVNADIRKNTANILKQLTAAKKGGADIVHFPEGALSGYAGVDMASFDGFDWDRLRACTRKVLDAARRLQLWVVVGSAHRLTGAHKPHNCLYIIDRQGKVIDRYDKLFCAGSQSEDDGDLAHYSPGNHFCTFELKGIRCGTLICHDYRYPELYREYKRRRVQVLFHSFHAGNMTPDRQKALQHQVGLENQVLNPGGTLPGITMPATMIGAAANNFLWISCSNTSARESCWPAFFLRPDGVVTGRLRRNIAGVLLSIVDTDQALYDSTVAWRERAMNGTLHSGTLVADKRSDNRQEI